MQKGIASVEIVLVIFIVALLATCAVPNAVRIIDRVALDYEVKRFYTDLRFLQSFDRMTNMNDSHFLTVQDSQVKMIVLPEKYRLEKNSNSKLYSEHYFSNGVKVSKDKTIKFDDMGKITPATSDTLYLASRLGKRISIVFDNVGRFRGARPDE